MNHNVNWMDNRVLNNAAPSPARTPAQPPTGRRQPETGATPPGEETRPDFKNGLGGQIGMAGANVMTEQGPPPVTERYYIPGYLASLIGKRIRAEFMIGSSLMVDRVGILREVGVNYFVLEEEISGTNIMCDLYSVKFVTSPAH